MDLKVEVINNLEIKALFELENGAAFRKKSGEYIYRKTNLERNNGGVAEPKQVGIFDIHTGNVYWADSHKEVVEVKSYDIKIGMQ